MYAGWPSRCTLLLPEDEELRQSTSADLMADNEAFEASCAIGTPFWCQVSKRSVFHKVVVQQFVAALYEADGEIIPVLRSFVERAFRTSYNSCMTEEGFLQDRRKEHTTSNMRMCEETMWSCLIDSDVLHREHSYDRIATDRVPTSHCAPPRELFHARPEDQSLDVHKIKGASRTPGWVTCSFQSQIGIFLELQLTRHCWSNDSWEDTGLSHTWMLVHRRTLARVYMI